MLLLVSIGSLGLAGSSTGGGGTYIFVDGAFAGVLVGVLFGIVLLSTFFTFTVVLGISTFSCTGALFVSSTTIAGAGALGFSSSYFLIALSTNS